MKKPSLKRLAGAVATVFSLVGFTGCYIATKPEPGCSPDSWYTVTCKDGVVMEDDINLEGELTLKCIDSDGNPTNISLASEKKTKEGHPLHSVECDSEGATITTVPGTEEVITFFPDQFNPSLGQVKGIHSLGISCRNVIVTQTHSLVCE